MTDHTSDRANVGASVTSIADAKARGDAKAGADADASPGSPARRRLRLPEDRATRLIIIWTMIVGCALAGVAFAYKIATFIFTLASDDFAGTFDVSIIVYFFVSGGWLCLLVWCFMTGKFRQMERDKYELLRMEEEYERLGI